MLRLRNAYNLHTKTVETETRMTDYVILGLFLLLVTAVFKCVKIASEEQRLAIFTFNDFQGLKGPGIVFCFPVAGMFTSYIKYFTLFDGF